MGVLVTRSPRVGRPAGANDRSLGAGGALASVPAGTPAAHTLARAETIASLGLHRQDMGD